MCYGCVFKNVSKFRVQRYNFIMKCSVVFDTCSNGRISVRPHVHSDNLYHYVL